MERRIRELKRQVQGLKAARDNTKDDSLRDVLSEKLQLKQVELKGQLSVYNTFCVENKLAPALERTNTYMAVSKAPETADLKEFRFIPDENGKIDAKAAVRFSNLQSTLSKAEMEALKDTSVITTAETTGYNPNTDTIYISDMTTPRYMYHEIGHVLETKGYINKEILDAVKADIADGLTAKDIKSIEGSTIEGTKKDIYYLDSPKLINRYQGCMYIKNLSDAILSDDKVDTKFLDEIVSVANECYHGNKELLRKKHPDMFRMIAEATDK